MLPWMLEPGFGLMKRVEVWKTTSFETSSSDVDFKGSEMKIAMFP